MKEIKKIVIVLIVLLFASVSISAKGEKESADRAENGKIKLSVLYYCDNTAANAADEEEVIWEKFKQENPDIELEIENLFGEVFLQKTEAYLASGNLPDVIYMWAGGKSATVHKTGAVKDLMPLLEKDGLVDHYNPAVLVSQYGGYLAELPEGITASHVLYANTKLLKENGLELPRTMDDLIAMVPVLRANGINVFGMDNMTTWVMQSTLFSCIVGRMGGADWYERLASGEITFTDDWFVRSLEIVDELYSTGVINRNSLNSTYGTSTGEFALGKCAFLVDGDWASSSLVTDNTTGKALFDRDAQENDIEMIVFPEIEGEVVHKTTSGTIGTGFAISASIAEGSKKEEAAWRLVKYLQGEYVQTYRLAIGLAFPSLLDVDVDEVIKENNLEPIVAKRAKFYQEHGTTPVIDDVLDSAVSNIIDIGLQELGLGEKTAMEVALSVQKAWEKYNK